MFIENHSYMMPAHFGGRPGGMGPAVYHDTLSATIQYETDEAGLAALLPPQYKLAAPKIMVSAIMNRGVEWMAGEPYNIVAVNAPAIYAGGDEDISGWYSLVVWENKTTPILTGREQTGIPKVYAEVEDFRFLGDEMRTWAHYAGHSFCDMHFHGIRDASKEEEDAIVGEFAEMNWMALRYIPQPGPVGGASLEEPTLYPQEFEASRVRVSEADIAWSVPPVWKNPTQAHFVQCLQDLKVGPAVGPAILMNAKNILRGDLSRVL